MKDLQDYIMNSLNNLLKEILFSKNASKILKLVTENPLTFLFNLKYMKWTTLEDQ